MKKLIFLTAISFQLLAISFQTKAQQTVAAANRVAPVITFQKDTIDYGIIPHNADGYRAFKFTNTGKEPLMISDTKGSCGCTVPTAPKEPIQPGQSAEIKVHYATDRIGQFYKTITVTSNAANSPQVLVIKGTILPDNSTANIKPITQVNPK